MIKNLFIYSFSNVLNKLTPFLLLPVLTHHLAADEFGVLYLIQVGISLFTALVGMQMNVNIPVNFARIDTVQMAEMIGNLLFITFCSMLICILLVLISLYVFDIRIIPISDKWIICLPLIGWIQMVNLINLTTLISRSKPISYSVFEGFHAILNLSLSLYLLLVMQKGLEGRLIGIIIPLFGFSVIGVFYLRKTHYLHFNIDLNKISSLLRFSLPLIPNALAMVILSISDRFFLANMESLEEVAFYSLAYNFGTVVFIFTNAFHKVWGPWFYKNLESADLKIKKTIVKYTYAYLVILFIGTIIYSLTIVKLLPFIVDSSYLSAGPLILWTSFSLASLGVYAMFQHYLVFLGKTKVIAISTGVAAIINLLGNYILIQQYGTIGAAYSTIIAYLSSAAIILIYIFRNYPMPWMTAFEN